MFEQLSDRLGAVFKKLRSRGKLHPKQVDAALDEIRDALLDADVAVEVADDLLGRVRDRVLSEEVMTSLTPGQQVVKVVRDELTETLGGTHRSFTDSGDPAVIMMAGLQGSAAVDQLFALGSEIGVPVTSDGRDRVKVAKAALKQARRDGHDVVIVDTAGRVHVDREMMREAGRIRAAIKPHHALMAVDATVGQDAVRQARAV